MPLSICDGRGWVYDRIRAHPACAAVDPDYDGAPCCPDPGCSRNPCTFPGYAANH